MVVVPTYVAFWGWMLFPPLVQVASVSFTEAKFFLGMHTSTIKEAFQVCVKEEQFLNNGAAYFWCKLISVPHIFQFEEEC